MMKLAAIAASFAACVLVAACGRSEQALEEPPLAPADPYPNDPASLDLWLERLEVGSRELYNARQEVAGALHLEPGARVADIGAGTGVYSLLFAERVGAEGVVYAVDIEPRFLTLINQRADDLGIDNIVSVLGRDDSITLPPGSVDVVFICDTYHYFDDPQAIMRTVLEALKPGGALYVIDYDLEPGAALPADKRHVRLGKAGVAAELEGIGFSAAEEIDSPGLTENYVLRFQKPPAP